ncbi:MAG: hypothetical protein H6Q56_1171 [Deltaproteobacteria bacterium]|jgi:hypothetical protein|nr:hypothetical protein [Deltaproteobacteria bacterium]
MKHVKNMKLGIAALMVYILGGIGVFGGIGLIVFMRGKDLLGLGEGHTIGYLLLCVGAGLSVLGVLLMRIFRNRGLA